MVDVMVYGRGRYACSHWGHRPSCLVKVMVMVDLMYDSYGRRRWVVCRRRLVKRGWGGCRRRRL
jgi:hypothetical protein